LTDPSGTMCNRCTWTRKGQERLPLMGDKHIHTRDSHPHASQGQYIQRGHRVLRASGPNPSKSRVFMHLFIHCIFTTIGCSILRLALGKPKALILLTLGCAQFGTPVELRSTIRGGGGDHEQLVHSCGGPGGRTGRGEREGRDLT
jgi:hypothetical protein